MSLLSAVEQLIKAFKVEQAKANDSIQHYREILHSLTPQPTAGCEDSEFEDAAATDASPGEKEDIELLERALEKALRVRTGSESSKKDSDRNKLSGPQKEAGTSSAAASMDVTQSSAASKGSQTSIKSTSKSAGLDRKGHKKPGLSVCPALGSRPSAIYRRTKQSKTSNDRNLIQNHRSSSAGIGHHQASRKLPQAVSASGPPNQVSAMCSKPNTVGSNMLRSDGLSTAASVSTPSNPIVPFSHTDETGACSSRQQIGNPSEQTTRWKSLRNKQSRLWDKVIALQRKPVVGRSHFMERMRATFPKDWPRGSPDQTRALADRLIHQGHDLVQLCRAKDVLAKRIPETAAELGGEENSFDSCLTPERLQLAAAELHNSADQVKQEWKAWDRWRPEGGCLCTTGAKDVWGDGIISPLPLTITYTTEAELQELEKLRMRVALLQQEIYLEQALLDTLSPQLSSTVLGPGCPNPSVLRDVYSLLGEGGERFPAIVLDSGPD